MRTAEQVTEMISKILEQGKPLKDTNVSAYRKLDDRLIALLWVLEHPKIETLIFTAEQLKLLSAFW